ncbi:MAG: NADH-quinone oxidoreductase subunit M [Pseudomonadota bacterium]
MDDHLLSIITFMPTFAALILAVFLRGDDEAAQRNAKWLAVITTTVTFLISLFVLFEFDAGDTGFQFVTETTWVLGLDYRMGIDGISLLFVMLTTFLMPFVVGASWRVETRVKEYIIALLFLETVILGAFMALDLILFYLFMEAALIPLFLLVGIWGGECRVAASFKLFAASAVGSILLLVALIAMQIEAGTSCIGSCDVSLLTHQFNSTPVAIFGVGVAGGMQTLLLLAFLMSFAVKLPIWPLHSWLSDVHAAAPTGASMVLSALILKIGGYGLLRFALSMFPIGSDVLAPMVISLAAIGVLYTALIALVQDNIKRLIAYASVAQMGLAVVAIFSGSQQGLEGALFHMVSHGVVIAALFFCVGVLTDRMQSAEIEAYGGLVTRMPGFAFIFLLFAVASLGLPGTSGFVGGFLTALGAFGAAPFASVVALIGMIILAAAILSLYRRVVLGELMKESLKKIRDLNARERLIIAPMVGATLILGIYPMLILDLIGPSVTALVENYGAAQDAALAGN